MRQLRHVTDWMNETKEDQNQYFPYVCKASFSNEHQILTLSSTPSFILFNSFHSLPSLSPLALIRAASLSFSFFVVLSIRQKLVTSVLWMIRHFIFDSYMRIVKEKTVTTAIHICILRYICCKTIYLLILLLYCCCFGSVSLSLSHFILSILHKLNRLFVLSDFKCQSLENARQKQRKKAQEEKNKKKEIKTDTRAASI